MLGYKHINTIYEGTSGRIVPTFIVFNGTTSLGIEPEVPKLPNGYTELNYVSASGGGIYINTGIPATSDYDAEYKIRQDGIHFLSAPEYFYPHFKMVGSDRVLFSNRFGSGKNIPYNYSYTSVYTVKVTGQTITVNGEVVTTDNVKGSATPTGTLYLFAYGGSPSNTGYHFKGDLYYLKLFDKTTGATLYDFVPCKNASGVVGLYDLINGTFYHSDTGKELAGY
jgi:hypothetical protein